MFNKWKSFDHSNRSYSLVRSNDFILQIIRLHQPCQQPRALAKLSKNAGSLNDEFLSIPVYGKYKFAVVKGSEKGNFPLSVKRKIINDVGVCNFISSPMHTKT